MGTRWERWLHHFSPMLTVGGWRWLWGAATKHRAEATVNRSLHTLTLREAKALVASKLGSTSAEWVIGQCVGTWECWLCQHKPIFVRRTMCWQSAGHHTWEADLALRAACAHRIGVAGGSDALRDVWQRPWWELGVPDGIAHFRSHLGSSSYGAHAPHRFLPRWTVPVGFLTRSLRLDWRTSHPPFTNT